jgi:hypothetical protein
MKLANSTSKSHQTFASVVLAFSLFGFLFPHHASQVKQQKHQVNLKTTEQTSQTKTDDSIPQYQWFY